MGTITLVAILAFIFGACITAVVLAARSTGLRSQLATLAAELAASKNNLAAAQDQLTKVSSELKLSTSARYAAESEAGRLGEQLKQQELQFEERMSTERQQSGEKLELLTAARVELSNQFEALANRILEEKTKRFTQQNQENLSQLLTPLSEKIKSFQQKVEDVYVKETEGRSALAEQVRMLTGLNQQLTAETSNLTRALTTSAKAQGDLGEMILEKILESSGLRKDEEYFVQNSFRNDESRNVRPDVIVKLPENKHLVIDSKVSLKAFEDYVNAGAEADRASALQRHLASMKTHIRTLGSKEYHLAAGSRLDYVLMFVPIEGALAAAIQADADLTSLAAECKVAIATPTTLMIALRTVANVWKVERRNKNAEAIADRAGLLYDKFCGFVEDLANIKKHLGKTTDAYEAAMSKLALGRGNLLTQVGMLRDLGARASKTLRNAQSKNQENEVEAVEPAESVGPEESMEIVDEEVGAEQ